MMSAMKNWWNRNMRDIKGCWPALVLIAIPFLITLPSVLTAAFGTHPTCRFDRNELGPKGNHGQWWWEFYKCSDGTERRQLVAGPRG